MSVMSYALSLSCFASSRPRTTRPRPRSAALGIERCETRRLLAGTQPLLAPTAAPATAALVSAPAAAAETFTFGFKHVNEAGADRHLVSSSGMRKYSEWQRPPITYWGPSANGIEGRLIYRFDFAAPAQSIRLKASSPTWNFNVEPGGRGRGVSAIEVSKDGQSWITLRDSIGPRAWGADWSVDEPLPTVLGGATVVWVRLRFLVEGAPNSSYTVAQFGRSTSAASGNVFALEATLRPQNRAPTDISLSSNAIPRDNAIGAVIGTLSASDPDSGDRHTFSLVNGPAANDNAAFRIEGRELRAAVAFAASARPNYTVRIRATDGGGLTVDRDFTVAVASQASRLARLSQVPGEGYARLVQGGIWLKQGETYRFTMRMVGPVTLQDTDHVPEFWGNGRIFDGTAKRSWMQGDWTYYEATVNAPVSGFYELKLALWSRPSLWMTDISLRSVATGAEIVRNGRFLDGLSGWSTHGGRLTMA